MGNKAGISSIKGHLRADKCYRMARLFETLRRARKLACHPPLHIPEALANVLESGKDIDIADSDLEESSDKGSSFGNSSTENAGMERSGVASWGSLPSGGALPAVT